MMGRFFGQRRKWTDGLSILPFALFAGLCFTIPYTLTGVFLGPEFPTLISSLLGLIIIVPTAKSGFLIPEDVWDFPTRKFWPSEWEGQKFDEKTDGPKTASIFRAWLPYVLVAVFLLASRLWPWLKNALASLTLNWRQIFNTQIDTSFQPLFLPGFLFLVVSILTVFIQRMSKNQIKGALNKSFLMLIGPTIALAFAVPMVKVFINSGIPGGLDKMPIILASGAASLVGKVWTGFAAVIGAMGAFIAGSNTFSNMMFSLFQFATAIKTGVVPGVIVALQAVGGAAGNMICVHNVVAASAVVGLIGKEGHLIRKTLIPMTYYLIIAAIVGIILLRIFKF
jgi:lactate permease